MVGWRPMLLMNVCLEKPRPCRSMIPIQRPIILPSDMKGNMAEECEAYISDYHSTPVKVTDMGTVADTLLKKMEYTLISRTGSSKEQSDLHLRSFCWSGVQEANCVREIA